MVWGGRVSGKGMGGRVCACVRACMRACVLTRRRQCKDPWPAVRRRGNPARAEADGCGGTGRGKWEAGAQSWASSLGRRRGRAREARRQRRGAAHQRLQEGSHPCSTGGTGLGCLRFVAGSPIEPEAGRLRPEARPLSASAAVLLRGVGGRRVAPANGAGAQGLWLFLGSASAMTRRRTRWAPSLSASA